MSKTKEQIAIVTLIKRATNVICSRCSLPTELKEQFALLKERIALLLSKMSDSHEKLKNEFPTQRTMTTFRFTPLFS